MKKILYLILHTEKQSERYHNIISTWGKNCDYLFYSDHEDLKNNIIKVSDNNSYNSAEEKFCNVMKLIPEDYKNYEWYFFCDNDTFVNTQLMLSNLENFSTDLVHGEVINSFHPDKSLFYLSGGAGYLVHKNIVKLMMSGVKNYNTGYSDVSFGYFLRDNNIKINDCKLFNSQPPPFFKIKYENSHNYITFHYIKKLDEMERLYKLSKKEF